MGEAVLVVEDLLVKAEEVSMDATVEWAFIRRGRVSSSATGTSSDFNIVVVSLRADIVGGEITPQKPDVWRRVKAPTIERCSLSDSNCIAVARPTWVRILLVETTVTVIMSA